MEGDAGGTDRSGEEDVDRHSFVSDLIYAIYPDALDRGIPLDVFWGSSVQEILAMMESWDRVQKAKAKEKISLLFTEADAIANRVGITFTEKKKRKESDFLQPWDVYPGLFIEERESAEEIAREKNLAEQKMAMNAYAERWNRRRREHG